MALHNFAAILILGEFLQRGTRKQGEPYNVRPSSFREEETAPLTLAFGSRSELLYLYSR